MPALFLGHGAPPLLDDALWTAELAGWAAGLPRPRAILIVSAHWETAPVSLSATAAATLFFCRPNSPLAGAFRLSFRLSFRVGGP